MLSIREDLLSGDHVRLTSVTDSDIAIIVTWYQDASTRRMFGDPAIPRSEEEVGEWVKGWIASPEVAYLGVRKLSADRLIGTISISGYRQSHRSATLGMEIDRAHREQGYGREALALALRFAFHELNLHRLSLTVAAYNETARRLYESRGPREGRAAARHPPLRPAAS